MALRLETGSLFRWQPQPGLQQREDVCWALRGQWWHGALSTIPQSGIFSVGTVRTGVE